MFITEEHKKNAIGTLISELIKDSWSVIIKFIISM